MSNNVELLTAYMSLVVSGDDIAPTARKAIGEADDVIDRATKATGEKAGNNLKAGFGLALGALTVGIGAWANEQVQALARVETIGAQTDAALKSTGAESWTTRSHIDDLAGSLEALTATEGEAITEGANLLLTFKNVTNGVGEGNDIFDQSVTAMTDMARAMGTDVKGGAVQLGKALNDPIKGVAALSKVGVGFTEDQKALIETMVASGDIMGAQKIILAELNGQFGGSGAAYADTYAGKLELIGHKWGGLGETMMNVAFPILEQGMDILSGFLTFLDENQWAVVTLASVIGVGLVGAFTLWAASIWATTAALLANPATWIFIVIAAAVAGLIALVYHLSDGFTNWGAAGGHALNTMIHGVNGLAHGLNGALRVLEALLSLGGLLGDWGWGEIGTIGLVDIPGLATGGTVTRSGTTLVGERGPELLDLPRGSSVIPLDHPLAGSNTGAPAQGQVNFHIHNPVAEPASRTLQAHRAQVSHQLGMA